MLAVPAVSFVATGLAVFGPLPPSFFSFLIVFLWLLALPGFMLWFILFGSRDLFSPERLPVYFALSVGILALPVLAVVLLQSTLTVLGWLALGVQMALFIGCLVGRVLRRSGVDDLPPIPKASGPMAWLTLSFALLVSVMVLFSARAGDDWGYLGYIRKYYDLNRVVWAEPFLGTGLVDWPAVLGFWSPTQALLARLIHTEPALVFRVYLPPVLAIVSILAFYSLARYFLKSDRWAFIATISQVVMVHMLEKFPHNWFFGRIANDKTFAWLALLPMALLFSFEYLERAHKGLAIVSFLLILGMAFVHPMALLLYIVSFGASNAVGLVFHMDRARLGRLMLLVGAVALVAFLPGLTYLGFAPQGRVYYFSPTDTQNPFVAQLLAWNEENLAILRNGLYVVPLSIVLRPPTRIIPFLLLFLAGFRLRKSVVARFVFANTVAPAGLMFLPWAASALGSFITPWLVYRLGWLFPVGLSLAYSLREGRTVFVRFTSARMTGRVAKNALYGLLSAVMVIAVIAVTSGAIQAFKRNQVPWGRLYPYHTEGVFRYMRANIVPGSVVMASEKLSWVLPSHVNARVVQWRGPKTLTLFSSEERSEAQSRIEAVNDFFDRHILDAKAVDILSKYGVDYVLVENSIQTMGLNRGLVKSREFEMIYQDENFRLYEWHKSLP